MSKVWNLIMQVLTPGGSDEFRAHLTQLTEEQQRLVRSLRILDDPVIASVTKASDQAADFGPQD